MARKDSERDVERPRYYSQFWLDVASGRRVIGTPRTDEEAEAEAVEPEIEEPVVLRKSGRNSMATVADADGHRGTLTVSDEPVITPEEIAEPELEVISAVDDEEVPSAVDDLDIPNILVEETEVPDMDLTPEKVEMDLTPEKVEEEEAEAEELETDLYEEDEEEDDGDWNLRGRKKAKPSRPTKLPTKLPPKKPGKREPRRSSGF